MPKKLTVPTKIAISALLIFIWAGTLIFIYTLVFLNPWMETSLRQQFDEGFFDFGEFTLENEEDNAEDNLDAIIAKYEPVFENLENTALKRLEDLYTIAVAEYHEKKAAGTYDRFQLANKYLQAGQLLENTVDSAFYALLENMEKELERKDLPADIVSEIEATYKETKQEKKEEMFDRLREEVER